MQDENWKKKSILGSARERERERESGLVSSRLHRLRQIGIDVVMPAGMLLLFSFMMAFVLGSVFWVPQRSQAVTGLLLVPSASTTSISLSSDIVTLDILPSPTGALASGSHTATVYTDAPTGYNFSLNRLGPASPNLVSTSGSLSAPTTLANNTWGYAIAKVSTSTAANTIVNGFDASYTTPTPSGTSLWAGVTSSPVAIKNTTQATGSSGDATVVYYGAKADLSITPGTYSHMITYTAVANLSAIPSPTIISVTPSSGSSAGGTAIQIVGTGFTVNDASVTTAVELDGLDCTSVTISSNTPVAGQDTIYCNTPAHAVGAVNVMVTTWGGSATRTNGYTYVLPVPAVSAISPDSGHFRGGEMFVITGTGFTGATAVSLVGSACRSFTVVSDTQISCVSSGVSTSLQTEYTTGAGSLMTNPTNVGSVNVTTPNGTSAANTLFTYRYSNSSLVGGGSYVDIMGVDLVLGAKIYVDGVACTNQKITGPTTAACTTPARASGARNITVVAPAASVGNMQNYSGCGALAVGTIITLTDTRDGQNYRVRKMEDAKCWMIDNLKLAGGVTLTSSNTNLDASVPADFAFTFASLSAPVQDSASHGNGKCTADSGVAIANGSGNLTCNGATYSDANDGFVAWSDPSLGTNFIARSCNNQYMINPDSLTNCGYLYNWYTATAGTGNFQKGANTSVTASICPAGWHLPYNTAINDFGVLNNSMLLGVPSTSSTTSSAATRPHWRYQGEWQGSLTGDYYAGGIYHSVALSSYLSARGGSSGIKVYILYFGSSDILFSESNGNRSDGYAIRCLL